MSYMPPPLSAFDQVRQAKARYCRLLDTRPWREFAEPSVDSPDIRIYGSDGGLTVAFSSGSEFTASARGFLPGAQSTHQVHNDELTHVSESEPLQVGASPALPCAAPFWS